MDTMKMDGPVSPASFCCSKRLVSPSDSFSQNGSEPRPGASPKSRHLANDLVDLDAKALGYLAAVIRVGLEKVTDLAHLNEARHRL